MKRRLLAIGALLVALVLALGASPAAAHDPLFLTDEQTTTEAGPLIPDGTISFALYGDLNGGGDTRGFQVTFDEGDFLLIDLLIPALSPETELAEQELPTALVTAPDGTSFTMVPEIRERFDEPFSSTSYVRLSKVEGTAQAGTYDVVVTSIAATRFTVAVGTIESFGTPVERVENRAATSGGSLADWYAGRGTSIEAGTTKGAADEEPEPTTEPTVEAASTLETSTPTATAIPAETAEVAPTEAATTPDRDESPQQPEPVGQAQGAVEPTAEETNDGDVGASAPVEAAADSGDSPGSSDDADSGPALWVLIGLGAVAAVVTATIVVLRQRREDRVGS